MAAEKWFLIPILVDNLQPHRFLRKSAMNTQQFVLTREYIELDKLLKLLSLAPSGGIAKMMVAEGLVSVNGEIEQRKTRKLRVGDMVQMDNEEIIIIA
jgi:ribosome-associated protein